MLIKDELQLIKSSILFRGVEKSTVDLILKQCQVENFRSDDLLFSAGDEAQQVYVILDGVVKLFRGADNGKHAVIGIREKGDIAGLTAVLSGRRNYSTAKTVRKCTALIVPAEAIKEIISRSPATGEQLVRKVADTVFDISQHIERLQLLQTTERLADYLLNTMEQNADSTALTLPCDKGLIATYLGMERESFSRALAKLRRVGVITKGRHIEITDTVALKQLRDQPM